MKFTISFSKAPIVSPVTYWLHQDHPKADRRLPRTLAGYPGYQIDVDGFAFQFQSISEIEYVIQAFSNKVLASGLPNQHWISRLPGWTKEWRYRSKAIRSLRKAMNEIQEIDLHALAASIRANTRDAKTPVSSAKDIQAMKKKRGYVKRDISVLSRSVADRRKRRDIKSTDR